MTIQEYLTVESENRYTEYQELAQEFELFLLKVVDNGRDDYE